MHGDSLVMTAPVIFGCKGTTLTKEEKEFFHDADPYGFILFARNCESPDQIRDLIKDLKTRDIGVLITDHNVRETLDIVDRACIIYGGQVLFAGTPEALVADANVRRLYLGEGFAM